MYRLELFLKQLRLELFLKQLSSNSKSIYVIFHTYVFLFYLF